MTTGTVPRARLDRLVLWGLDRFGGWYLHVVLAVAAVHMVVLTVPVQTLTQFPFWLGGFSHWAHIWQFVGLAVIGAPLALFGVVLPRHRPVVAYLRGRPADPVDVWRACVTRLPGSVTQAVVVLSVVVVGVGTAWVGPHLHFGPATYVGAYLSQLLIMLSAVSFYLMLFERALLPIAVEVAAQLPPGFEERAPIMGRRRQILLSTAITCAVGCQTAGLSLLAARTGRSWIVVVATVGLGLTYIAAQVSLVSSSVTRRVDELAAALNAVARGEESVRILPTSGDEFDSVGASFNTMVDLLEVNATELRRSRARLVSVGDATRRHIERDLHDGAQQNLALLSMQLGQLAGACADRNDVAEQVRRIRSDVIEVLTEMRRFAHGVYPASLEAEGLRSALRAATRERRDVVHLTIGERRWPHDVEAAIYFSCWEILGPGGFPTGSTVRIGVGESPIRGAQLSLSIDPAPEPARVDEVRQFVSDRMGAVGGAVTTSVDADGLQIVATVGAA